MHSRDYIARVSSLAHPDRNVIAAFYDYIIFPRTCPSLHIFARCAAITTSSCTRIFPSYSSFGTTSSTAACESLTRQQSTSPRARQLTPVHTKHAPFSHLASLGPSLQQPHRLRLRTHQAQGLAGGAGGWRASGPPRVATSELHQTIVATPVSLTAFLISPSDQ